MIVVNFSVGDDQAAVVAVVGRGVHPLVPSLPMLRQIKTRDKAQLAFVARVGVFNLSVLVKLEEIVESGITSTAFVLPFDRLV